MLARNYSYYEEDYELQRQLEQEQRRQAERERREQAACRAVRRYFLAVVLVCFAGYMTCVGLSSWAMHEGRALLELQRQEKLLSGKNSELKIEVEQMRSPNRIISFAEKQMDMRVARSNIYVNAAKAKNNSQAVALADK